jgi:hypothetical protein
MTAAEQQQRMHVLCQYSLHGVLTDAQGVNNSEITVTGSRGDHDFVRRAPQKRIFFSAPTWGMPAADAALCRANSTSRGATWPAAASDAEGPGPATAA